MRKTVSLIAAAIVVVVGTALTALPLSAFGMDPGSLGAMEAILATILATVLTWNALR